MTKEELEFWKTSYAHALSSGTSSSDAEKEAHEAVRRLNTLENLTVPNCGACIFYKHDTEGNSWCDAQQERKWEQRYGSQECYRLYTPKQRRQG